MLASTLTLSAFGRRPGRAVPMRRRDLACDRVLAEDAVQEAFLAPRRRLRLERQRLQMAPAVLPDRQREAIELAYYGGLAGSQLAKRLGRPLGTIKSRMSSGFSRLRELLEDGLDLERRSWTSTA